MSQENVEKVRTSLAEWDGMVLRPEDRPFERTIFSAATGLIDPDSVYESSVLPDQAGETYRGADAWARAAETWLEPCEWMVVDLEQVLDAPEDRVVSLHRVHMKMRSTSLEFGHEQVPRETATSANARHECFVMDASVSVRTAEPAEMDEIRSCRPMNGLHLLPAKERRCPYLR